MNAYSFRLYIAPYKDRWTFGVHVSDIVLSSSDVELF